MHTHPARSTLSLRIRTLLGSSLLASLRRSLLPSASNELRLLLFLLVTLEVVSPVPTFDDGLVLSERGLLLGCGREEGRFSEGGEEESLLLEELLGGGDGGCLGLEEEEEVGGERERGGRGGGREMRTEEDATRKAERRGGTTRQFWECGRPRRETKP